MLTSLLYGLAGFAGLCLYFKIGVWLGQLRWWSWNTNKCKNRVLAWLLFPYATATNDESLTWIHDLSDYQKNEFYFINGVFWSLTVVATVVSPIVAIGAGIFFLGYRCFALLLFSLLGAPTAAWEEFGFKIRLGSEPLIEQQVRVTETPPPAVVDTDPALTEYRDLLKQCVEGETKLAPIRARMAELEEADAAQNEPFRTEPLEARARRA